MQTDLIARLVADADVTALVGQRVSLNRSPQGDGLPRIVITTINTDSEHHLGAATGFKQGRVQIDCHAQYAGDAETLAEKVRLSLDGFRGTMGGTFVSTMHLSDERSFETAPQSGADDSKAINTVQVDYMIGWRVPVPSH